MDGDLLLDRNGFDSAAIEHIASVATVEDHIDIGGFGEISGCLHIMKNSNHQVI
jgi:DNA repair and recombination protein RAD54 and RAD54-like protein